MRLRPLHPEFGAEVLDVDLARASSADIDALRAAYDEHQLLLFRGRHTPPELQVEMTGWFGPVVCERDDGQMWTVLHNRDLAGGAKLPYHCDHSYTECPVKGISLQAIELPPRPTATNFVSSRNAWRRLSPALQDKLAPTTLRHSYGGRMTPGWPTFISDHPLRLTHPRTGEPVLFVTEHHAERIVELEPEDSARTISDLFSVLYAPERVYSHQWRLHDLLIWDNLMIQHARPEATDVVDGARAMQRVSISNMTFAEILDRALKREAAAASA